MFEILLKIPLLLLSVIPIIYLIEETSSLKLICKF